MMKLSNSVQESGEGGFSFEWKHIWTDENQQNIQPKENNFDASVCDGLVGVAGLNHFSSTVSTFSEEGKSVAKLKADFQDESPVEAMDSTGVVLQVRSPKGPAQKSKCRRKRRRVRGKAAHAEQAVTKAEQTPQFCSLNIRSMQWSHGAKLFHCLLFLLLTCCLADGPHTPENSTANTSGVQASLKCVTCEDPSCRVSRIYDTENNLIWQNGTMLSDCSAKSRDIVCKYNNQVYVIYNDSRREFDFEGDKRFKTKDCTDDITNIIREKDRTDDVKNITNTKITTDSHKNEDNKVVMVAVKVAVFVMAAVVVVVVVIKVCFCASRSESSISPGGGTDQLPEKQPMVCQCETMV